MQDEDFIIDVLRVVSRVRRCALQFRTEHANLCEVSLSGGSAPTADASERRVVAVRAYGSGIGVGVICGVGVGVGAIICVGGGSYAGMVARPRNGVGV